MDGRISHGVTATNGDATVPLISLGFMCAKGWKHPRFNPSNLTTIAREYFDDGSGGLANAHSGINFLRRVTSSDHVDIMGNTAMIEDLLRILSGGKPKSEAVSDAERDAFVLPERVLSNIRHISERIRLD